MELQGKKKGRLMGNKSRVLGVFPKGKNTPTSIPEVGVWGKMGKTQKSPVFSAWRDFFMHDNLLK